MTWLPGVTVTIGGVSYTSKTVDSIQVSYGRTNVWEQPRSGYATINLVQFTETFIDFKINASVIITIKNSSAVDKTIFTGTLNSVDVQRIAEGSIQGVTNYIITAVGPFAKMARTNIGGSNYPKEFDDDRMDRILTEAGVTIDVIDTPAVYELAARSGSLTDAYTLAASTATEVFGYIYETTLGEVGYANQSRRLNDVQANGFFQIPSSYIYWNTLSTNKSLSNVLNQLSLDYDAGTVTASSAGSISTYGPAGGKIVTSLHNSTDAQNLADFYIATRAVPQANLSNFSIYLHTDQLTNADRNELIEIYLGKPVDLADLPAGLFSGTFAGFVEGWTISADRVRARIDLTCTDQTLSLVPTRWQDIDPLIQWEDLGATIRWFEYE